MYWKKWKRLRKIAHAHGKAHYYEWNHKIRTLCQLNRYMTYIKEGGIPSHQLVDELNKLYVLMGVPEYCITWEQIVREIAEEQDRMIFQFIDECYSTPSIEVTKPTSIVVKNNFHKKLENAVSEMCDRDKPVQLGYIDYLGIEKLNGPIKEFHEAVCECLRDPNPISEYHGIVEGVTDNESSS